MSSGNSSFSGGSRNHPQKPIEPRSMELGLIVSVPIRFLIFIVLVVVGTNCMPFAKDGSRMNLFTGGIMMIVGEADGTAPFAKVTPGSQTDHEAIIPFEEAKRNEITGFVIDTSKTLMVDQLTTIILMLMILGMVWTLVLGMFALPFTVVEKRISKIAFNNEISNAGLKSRFSANASAALLFDFILSVIFTLILFGKIKFEGGLTGGIVLFGLNFHPFMLAPLAFFMFYGFREYFRSRRYLGHIFTRRCVKCFNMDTYALIDRKYIKTNIKTIDSYETKTDANGNTTRRKTGSRQEKLDIYKNVYECRNCGDKFSIQSI